MQGVCPKLLFLLLSLTLSSSTNLKNVSDTLEELIADYDIRLRPKFGGKALVVDIDIIIASFDAISEVNMDYTITMYLNQYWRDERLEWGEADKKMTLTAEFAKRIWVPDTFFANDKHSFLHKVTESNKMIRLSGDGSIAYGMRFTTTLACMMDLLFYPLDIQNCTVEIESYGYPMEDVEMRWRVGRHSVVGVEEVELPQFELVDYDTLSTIQVLASGAYQRLSLSFLLKRHIGYFIFQTFLPSILIVMLSWVSFWINHEATSARVGLGITTVLTMTTISTGVRASLPRISYVKAIDIYLVMCFVFVFVALMEYAAVNYCFWGARAKKKKKKHQQQQALVANTSAADRFAQPYDVSQCNGRVTQNKRGNESKMIGFEHLSNPLELVEGSDSKLNEMGDIELTEVSPLNQPSKTETTFSDEDYNPSSPNNNSNDFNVHKDLTPRLRRPQGFPTARNNKASRWGNFRQKTKSLKMPKVKDVNNIDKYSRLVFPLLFLLFNAWYWVYYSVLSNMAIKGSNRR